MTCLVGAEAAFPRYPLIWRRVRHANARRKPCERCHRPKPPGKSRRFCDDCQPDRSLVGICKSCKSAPITIRAGRYCDECRTVHAEAAAARKKASEIARRLPCKRCGKVKPPGKGLYCAGCRRARSGPRVCERCPNPARSKHSKLCDACKAASRLAARDYQRQWHADHPGRRSGGTHQDSRRMHDRLRRERAGHELKPAEPILRADGDTTRADASKFRHLPARPLAAFVHREIRALAAGPHWKGREVLISGDDGKYRDLTEFSRGDDVPSPTETMCERFGITSKTLREWTSGLRPTVRFDVADKVVTRADVLWFDVFSECRVGCESLPVGPVCSACDAHARARIAFEGQ